ESKGITQPTQLQIREAIIDIRSKKLPDPKDIPSVGSFFKNPIVNAEQYEKLKAKYPDVKAFPKDSGDYKISAGWLLEASGYKGKTFGNLQFYENNALVITNIGEATFAELEELVKKTKAHIKQAFDIDLEVEPIIV
ncbi:MAG TPA: UDP-N-acetylenolpyruvoylglucosamine reductase, partial [Patescibacteria group bacterium]|nr:UDP-N-acetylenolpyruvoylglucosamine reductase [Patescibacteria group bacterium]